MSSISEIIASNLPNLSTYEELYKHFHSHPELSFMEKETAARIVLELENLRTKYKLINEDFVVNSSIGGHGIAATFSNSSSSGPTILLRADFDGLPVEERTGLPYASTARQKDRDGVEHQTMHACGHDMHITALLAVAELLFKARDEWNGTLLLIFQPAEEKGAGAQAMVEDGLYSKKLAPEPDVVLGAHVISLPTGSLGTRAKAFASAADSMKITLYGRGGHASMPHATIDPVTLAAFIITRLQTIISREIPPYVTASITVASVHAGFAENVIPEFAELKVNVRTWDDETRKDVLSRIKRIVNAECTAHGAPKPALFETISAFPLTYNDEDVTAKLSASMTEHFGNRWNPDITVLPGSEDFPILATSIGKPSAYFVYGGLDPSWWERKKKEGIEPPVNHSAYFAPVIQPTLKNAVEGYAVAALTWLKKS